MKITVVGIGFVGLGTGLVLSRKNEVVMHDVDSNKVNLINSKITPVEDSLAEKMMSEENLNLRATLDKIDAYDNTDYVIISVPTDYNPETQYFNTKIIENVIKDVIQYAPEKTTTIIKSTIPIGYVEKTKKKFGINNIVFSPEFLREGTAVYDNLNPSRIILGEDSERARIFADLLVSGADKEDINVLFMNNTEAEAVKLFSNGYLAMRVAFFNELDNYCIVNNLNTGDIINGVGADPRIGNYYNNPSFGYSGICLPKDTKQLKANYSNVPNALISAIVESNEIRKNLVTNEILNTESEIIGIHRLIVKNGSENFRSSAILEIIDNLISAGKEIIIYEPIVKEDNYEGIRIVNDLAEFKKLSNLIVANRYDKELEDVKDKVYTRDVFTSDV